MKLLAITLLLNIGTSFSRIPVVINTWGFQQATQKAWDVLNRDKASGKGLALDALEAGCKICQDEQCDNTVGYGGSPDENGESTLDALIFDGNTIDVGAVAGIRKIKNAISAARYVLEYTEHSLLVGSLATEFAKQMGLHEENLATNYSINMWQTWKGKNCQPNFWKNVRPDPKLYCGPYHDKENSIFASYNKFNKRNHDTIGMIIISPSGHVVAGTSSNGAKFKIPGRVGDSPIPGAGAYADSMVGAAAATGDGDIMIRFSPSFLAVELMRQGVSSAKAATIAISRIAKKYPHFFGGIIVVDKKGNVGAACHGMAKFPYTVANDKYPNTVVKYVNCINIQS